MLPVGWGGSRWPLASAVPQVPQASLSSRPVASLVAVGAGDCCDVSLSWCVFDEGFLVFVLLAISICLCVYKYKPMLDLFHSLAVSWPCSTKDFFHCAAETWKKCFPFSKNYGTRKSTGKAWFFPRYHWHKGDMNFPLINWSILVVRMAK